jgi:hypothetical protein
MGRHGPLRLFVSASIRRWVMSHTTRVFHVSDVAARLTDLAKAPISVTGVSRRPARPAGLVSKSVSRCELRPAASGSLHAH